MSKTTIALEAAVATVIANRPADGSPTTNRQRVQVDRAFAAILKLIAPRIRHFIRQYGLSAHWDDAEQCCAIGVHRAIEAYDPQRAQFTTFVNWQLRGELQSLRFRVMTDQRPSAKKVDATTVSMHALASSADGEELSLESMIEDGEALARTEAGASDVLAGETRSALIDLYVQHLRTVGIEQLRRRARADRSLRQPCAEGAPRLRSLTQALHPAALSELEAEIALECDIVERRLFDEATLDELGIETGIAKERIRQISKRAATTMAGLAAADPRFDFARKMRRPGTAVSGRAAPARAATTIMPDQDALHNQLARVVAIAAAAGRDTVRLVETAYDDGPLAPHEDFAMAATATSCTASRMRH